MQQIQKASKNTILLNNNYFSMFPDLQLKLKQMF